jgi:signal transduction histidine kinase/ligand-binding sensor domain-containing protein/DNA-binding response OmpR family regulator
MPYRKFLPLTVFLLTAVIASANGLPIRSLGIEDGLSNNAVTCIYQDYRGFMWFGTYDGLNRYDGYNFTIYRNRIGDPQSLVTNSVYSIEGDEQHNLWIGGQKGACIFDPVKSAFTTLSYLPVSEATPNPLRDNVHVIKSIRNGNVLVGTNHTGLLLFEHNARTGTQILLPEWYSDRNSYDVTAIETNQDASSVWVFVQQIGLFLYNTAHRSLQLVNKDIQQANCLSMSKDGKLWLGNEKGLFVYDAQQNRYSDNYISRSCKVVNICEDKNGVLWIATDGSGLFIQEKGASVPRPFTGHDGHSLVNSNAVYSIYEDKEARKWIGTLRGGINIIEASGSAFRQVTFSRQGPESPASNFIFSFCEDAQHNLWIGTDGAGLRYWNRHSNTFTSFRHEQGDDRTISSNFITSIVRDAGDRTWISTWFGGVNRFNPATNSFEHYTCYNPVTRSAENNVWLLYEDSRKNLWASATNDGSLYLFNPSNNSFELYDAQIQNLQCMAEDKNGDLWGGNYTSLIRIGRNGRQHRIYPIGYTIRSLHEDRFGNFWVGTQEGGLLLFDRKTGKYQRFSTNEGLPNNTILRMLEDNNGHLWLSTFNGLSKFNVQNRTCRNFSQLDGLQSNQFSFNAAFALSSGEFAFGGIKGFNIFYPDSVQDVAAMPAIFLTGLSIDGKPAAASAQYITSRTLETIREVKMPYNRAVLSLDFLALAYTGADKISYAYYLEGWDKSWNYVNNIRAANYSRLQEGHYTFHVKVKNPDGKWSEPQVLLNIIVLPPWYRTWWAYTLYIIGALLVIYLYLRYTKRQERLRYEIKLAHLENEKDKELTEKKLSFFTHISHEFRAPLSMIINPLKEIIQQKNTAQDERGLNIVYRNARRLLSLVDQLLLFRKADSGADTLKISRVDIVHLCHEVFQCFVQQAKAKNIHYHFTAPAEPVEIYADHEKLEIVLFNLLSNAFKFTPDGGAIECHVAETAKTVVASISDTGCGIDQADIHRIFEKFQQAVRAPKTGFGIGLYLAKHFIESHKGAIAVKSVPQKGTTFTITLQKGMAHLPAHYTTEEAGASHQLLEELIEDEALPIADQKVSLHATQGRHAEELITDKKTILVVDDNPEIRNYLEHIFREQYVLFTAENGLKGLEMATQHLPDIIISDINMDGLDGLELCRKIKRSEVLGHIPVILLTAASSTDTQLKGIEGGADDYITKPFDTQLLQARVGTILKNRNLLQRYFFDSITLQESAIKVPTEYRDFLKKCIQVVEENMDAENFTIQQFSKLMGMSRSALYNKVKHISGQSLNAFVRSIRLRRAAVLMIKEQLNVNQAAFQVGIGDVRYFREQFVKLFGMTPSDYIKKYRQSFNGDLSLLKTEED